MIFPDINLLIYAYDSSSEHHKASAEWLESVLNGNVPVCFSWHTIMGFVRILTTVRMVRKPLTTEEAVEIAGEFIALPNSRILQPGENHFKVFSRLAKAAGISGVRLADAHIAALAIEHGAAVASADKDFRVFDGLNLINPLASN